MVKTIIGGIAVGIANVIPGVSGGTMMVILGIFNRVMDAISGIFKRHNPDRMKDILFLFQVLVGAAIGLVGFAKVIQFLFNHYPTQTYYWFIGLVAFSIPVFMKAECKGEKISWIPLIIGAAVVFVIKFLAPDAGSGTVNPSFPDITLMHCLTMILCGAVAGGTMLLPGVSGSMVLLIFGQYHLFKSYLASVTTFQPDVLISLFFMGIGILLGIVISAKLTGYFLKKYHRGTLSVILGLIIASSIVLIPLDVTYSVSTIVTCGGSLLFGGFLVYLLEKIA